MINLKIKTLDSQDHDFTVDEEMTIRTFKEHIEQKTGISANIQRLIYCGRVLTDDRQLKDYDVNGKVVHLVQRPPPSIYTGVDDGQAADSDNTNAQNPGRERFDRVRNMNVYRAIDGMVLGAMAIPMNSSIVTQPQPIGHSMNPSSTLCMNRITVARHMLNCTNNIINYLENPEVGLNNIEMDVLAQQTMESTVFEVGISAVGDVQLPQQDVQDFVQVVQGAVSAALRQQNNELPNVLVSHGGGDSTNISDLAQMIGNAVNIHSNNGDTTSGSNDSNNNLNLTSDQLQLVEEISDALGSSFPIVQPINVNTGIGGSNASSQAPTGSETSASSTASSSASSSSSTTSALSNNETPESKPQEEVPSTPRTPSSVTVDLRRCLSAIEIDTETHEVEPTIQHTQHINIEISPMTTTSTTTTTTPQATASTSSTITLSNGNERSDSRQQVTCPRILAEVVQQMRTVQSRLEPFLQQYYDILLNDPAFSENENTGLESAQRIFDRVSEALHYLAHAQHAISDLMFDLSQARPRHLYCRPILVEQSAFVSSGLLPLQISRRPETADGTATSVSTSTTNTLRTTTPSSTTTTTPPSSVSISTSESSNTYTISIGDNDRMRQLMDMLNVSRTLTSTTSDSTTTNTTTGGTNPNVTSANIRPVMMSVPTTGTNASNVTRIRVGPRSNFQEVLLEPIGQALREAFLREGANVRSRSTSRSASPRSRRIVTVSAPIPTNVVIEFPSMMTVSSAETASVPPSSTAGDSSNAAGTETVSSQSTGTTMTSTTSSDDLGGGDGSGGTAATGNANAPRVTTATHPTTSTQTRSTARPQLHVTSIQPTQMRNLRSAPALQLTSFDRFLPCNSHHIRENNDRQQQQQQQQQLQQQQQQQLQNQREQPHTHIHHQHIRLTPRHRISSRRNATNRDGTQQPQTQRRPRVSSSPTDELSSLTNDEFNTRINLFGSQLQIRDLINIAPTPATLNRIRTDLVRFITEIVFNGEAVNHNNMDSATNRVITMLNEFLTNLPQFELPDYDARGSIENLIRYIVPVVCCLIDEDDSIDFGMRLLRHMIIFVRRFFIILVTCVGRSNAALYLNQVGGLILISENETEQNAISALKRHIMAAVMRQLGATRDDASDVTQFLVIRRPAPPSSSTTIQQPNNVSQEIAMETEESTDENLVTMIDASNVNGEADKSSPSELIDDKEKNETLPSIVVGSESWHSNFPSQWLPVITRDLGRQRRQNTQAPYSDAYMSGMSSKRRKIINNSKPSTTEPTVSLFSDGLRHTIQQQQQQQVSSSGVSSGAGGSTTSLPIDEILASSQQIQEPYGSFEQALRRGIENRLNNDPDFTPEKYPNSQLWLNKK